MKVEESQNQSSIDEALFRIVDNANTTILSLVDCVIYLTEYINKLEESKKD